MNLKKRRSPDQRQVAEIVWSGLDVRSTRSQEKTRSLRLYLYGMHVPRMFAWSADSQAIGFVNDDWCGLWHPFAKSFFRAPLRLDFEVAELAVLPEQHAVICRGESSSLYRIDFPTEPTLTPWQTQVQLFEEAAEPPAGDLKREWKWDENQYGYEGVNTFSGYVLWYSHTHNPHGGGMAHEQPFEDFLENGPNQPVPPQVLKELYFVVQKLAGRN